MLRLQSTKLQTFSLHGLLKQMKYKKELLICEPVGPNPIKWILKLNISDYIGVSGKEIIVCPLLTTHFAISRSETTQVSLHYLRWEKSHSTFIVTVFTQLLSHKQTTCPVGWGCRIHRLHLCRGVTPQQTSVPDMTLNNLMVRFQWCWSFGKCGVTLYCHCSQVHSSPEW